MAAPDGCLRTALDPAGTQNFASLPKSRDIEGCKVMLRNLPNRAKKQRGAAFVKDLGFGALQLQVPIDEKTGINKGYAFVRFQSRQEAQRFCDTVSDTQLPGPPGATSSLKRLTAVFAQRQPGKPSTLNSEPHSRSTKIR